MKNPFAELVGFTLQIGRRGSGASKAVLEAHMHLGRLQVAQALGTFAVFVPRAPHAKRSAGAKRRRLSK